MLCRNNHMHLYLCPNRSYLLSYWRLQGVSSPLLPWPALSSALLHATEWLQWNVMTTVWTKPAIHSPSSHSGSLRLGALITEWGAGGGGQSPSTPRLSDTGCPPLHAATSATHLGLFSFCFVNVVEKSLLKPRSKRREKWLMCFLRLLSWLIHGKVFSLMPDWKKENTYQCT